MSVDKLCFCSSPVFKFWGVSGTTRIEFFNQMNHLNSKLVYEDEGNKWYYS